MARLLLLKVARRALVLRVLLQTDFAAHSHDVSRTAWLSLRACIEAKAYIVRLHDYKHPILKYRSAA